ncbi:MAG TPA: hypothetical protein PLB21_14010, partial [Actinomycetota bacterium]|nr:hypothetical protein [Actinomycetota bacterium]
KTAGDITARCAGLGIPMTASLAAELAAALSDPEPDRPVVATPESKDEPDWLATPGTFASIDWDNAFGAEPSRAVARMLTRTDDAGTSLSWQDPVDLGRTRLFRVVQSPDSWPTTSPDSGQSVGVTTKSSVTAALSPTSAVTYLALWCHAGPDEVTARLTPPVLVATGHVVWPPRALALAVTPVNTVVARFKKPEGAEIQVQRFAAGTAPSFDMSAALDASVLTGDGFVDPKPPVGRVTYAVYASTRLQDGSQEWSEPVVGMVTIRVRPQSVPITVRASVVNPGTYDIQWPTPEHGAVEIYLTPSALPAGLSDEPRTLEIVQGQGLTPERHLPYPSLAMGDTTLMQGVAIPQDWARAHFVATHVLDDDLVGVGPTVGLVLPRPPRSLQLIERVDTQIIAFAWPGSETGDMRDVGDDVIVEVHQGPRHSAVLDVERSQAIVTMTREQYYLLGGIHLTQTLPPNGCSLHLYGVIYEAGRPRRSEAAVLDYPGITRVAYDVVAVRADGRPVTSPDEEVAALAVTVVSNEVLDEGHFVVVQHPQRLPLSPQEPGARELLSEVQPLTPNVTLTLGHLRPGPSLGFLRLFYSPPDRDETARVAVIDPSVQHLWKGVL